VKRIPIRWRLSLAFALAMAVVLSALGAFLYVRLDRSLTAAELDAVRPAFGDPPGRLDPAQLRAWAAWDVRFGILNRAPDVARAFVLS